MASKKYYIYSWFLLLSFFIPIVINFAHSFEHKDHYLCTAKNVKHFHKEQQDCSAYHYVIHNFTLFSPAILIKLSSLINTVVITEATLKKSVILFFKSSRAPPIL